MLLPSSNALHIEYPARREVILPFQIHGKGKTLRFKLPGKFFRYGPGNQGVPFYLDQPASAAGTQPVIRPDDQAFLRTEALFTIVIIAAFVTGRAEQETAGSEDTQG